MCFTVKLEKGEDLEPMLVEGESPNKNSFPGSGHGSGRERNSAEWRAEAENCHCESAHSGSKGNHLFWIFEDDCF